MAYDYKKVGCLMVSAGGYSSLLWLFKGCIQEFYMHRMEVMVYCEIREVGNSNEKIEIMKKCDAAFPIRLFERRNCDEIIDRIIHNAFFYAAFCQTGGGVEVVGYNAFYANDKINKVAYISSIGVIESFQGFHIGCGLMKKCIEKSQSEGMEAIRLEVLNTNTKAIMFYEKWLFEHEKGGKGETSFMRRSL